MLINRRENAEWVGPPREIEEMNGNLTKVTEDFDRAVNVEALRTAKEIGKHSILPQFGRSSSLVVSLRASALFGRFESVKTILAMP